MAELTHTPSQHPARLSDRVSGPPSGRFSLPPGVPVPPPEPTLVEAIGQRVTAFLGHLGHMSLIFFQSLSAMFRRPLEFRAIAYQMESLGVRSVGIASVTAVFIGM